MIIEESDKIAFGKVPSGNVFEAFRSYWIKISEENNNAFFEDGIANAVCLNDGSTYTFSNVDVVRKIHCPITIKN